MATISIRWHNDEVETIQSSMTVISDTKLVLRAGNMIRVIPLTSVMELSYDTDFEDVIVNSTNANFKIDCGR